MFIEKEKDGEIAPSSEAGKQHSGVPLDAEVLLSAVVNSLQESFVVAFDRQGTYIGIWGPNDLEERYGVRSEDILGKSLRDVFPPSIADNRILQLKEIFASGETRQEEDFFVTPKGGFWHEISLAPLRDPSGHICAVVGFIRDVTPQKTAELEVRAMHKDLEERVRERSAQLSALNKELKEEIQERKRIEEALEQSEKRYRSIYENAQVGLVRGRIQDGKVLEANLKAAQIFGYDNVAEFMEDFLFSEHYVDHKVRERMMAELYRCGEIKDHEVRLTHKDGSIIFTRWTIEIFPDQGWIQGVVTDVTEEKKAAEALKESEERFRTLVENVPVAIYRSTPGPRGRFLTANPAFLNMFGLKEKELKQLTVADLYRCPEDRERFSEKLLACESISGEEIPLKKKDGTKIWGSVTAKAVRGCDGNVLYFDCMVVDITQQKEVNREKEALKEQLYQAQKMKALGTLAGGIAHDFNNILTAMIGYTELAKIETAKESKARRNLVQALTARKRAKDLVGQILAFSRQTELEMKPFEITPIIKETVKLLRASLPATIAIRVTFGVENSTVRANPGQIHQVLMNLCTNAAHAMGDRNGTLEVMLTEERRDVSHLGELDPGDYLRLTVKDTGCGMSPDIVERIFDPYFTTKKRGEGTGLGLAVVNGIVKNCGGTVEVQSEPGKGSSFHVYLPRTEWKDVSERKSGEDLPSGHERVLLVDDEQHIVDLTKQMLEHLGYEVVTRTSSLEALELFHRKPDHFDLVITDMTMSNMTGEELARAILNIRPDTPIVLCTGFSETMSEERAKAIGIREFAMKPLVMWELARIVRRALD